MHWLARPPVGKYGSVPYLRNQVQADKRPTYSEDGHLGQLATLHLCKGVVVRGVCSQRSESAHRVCIEVIGRSKVTKNPKLARAVPPLPPANPICNVFCSQRFKTYLSRACIQAGKGCVAQVPHGVGNLQSEAQTAVGGSVKHCTATTPHSCLIFAEG